MSDSLYERDVLAWPEHQADLLRRLSREEQVNDVDWANVAEGSRMLAFPNCTRPRTS